MNMRFWKFWTVFVLVIFSLVTGQIYFGLFDHILAYDQTYITFVNIGILILAHLMMLRLHWKKKYAEQHHRMLHYLADTVIVLGLIGTLIGFIIILWSVFGPGVVIDPTNVSLMTDMISQVAQGMGAALITSLSGLISSAIISLQLVFLEE